MVDRPPRRLLPVLTTTPVKTTACLLATALTASAMEPSSGSLSAPQTFAVRNGTQFANSSLDAYEGKILVIMMMTPWCPFCQSNASAVGDGILDPFNATSRGVLRGKNDHGIEIRSLLLSTEPAAQWDATNSTFATNNGYQQWGLDATAQRQSPRVMLGYYRGGYPNGINSSNLYDWGEDRRRVTVLNLVRDSASHGYREIVLNRNAFSASDAAAARAMINSITPPPETLTFAAWGGGLSFPAGQSDADDDPDRDGSVNLLEFFHGTHPLQPGSRDSGSEFVREGTALKLVYRRAKNRSGITVEHRTSGNLNDWEVLDGPLPESVVDLGEVEEVAVTLPTSAGPARFYQLGVALDASP